MTFVPDQRSLCTGASELRRAATYLSVCACVERVVETIVDIRTRKTLPLACDPVIWPVIRPVIRCE